jgi:hypothetical protein
MSVYDQRDKPSYDFYPISPEYSNNPYILSWWSSEHDKLVSSLIDEWQWDWPWHVTDEVKKITPSQTIEDWRAKDPMCRSYAWYNVIMFFALSRAQVQGLTAKIRKPHKKVCPLCNQEFIESSLPAPLVTRLGINGLDFCSPCLQSIVFPGTGNPSLSKEQILEYLRNLTNALQQIPHQGFGEGMEDLRYLDKHERIEIIKLLRDKPSVGRVKQLFGSWLKALIDAGVLEDETRKTSRGTQCIARDGHICYSLVEKTIDDYLFCHKLPHEKEPMYPGSNMRADFLVGSVFIEYFGLKGDPEYDAKTKTKEKLCSDHGITLIPLYPEDLVNMRKFEKKISNILKAI